jgi:photosystem II stability/assembly factor-like uncharacterized protein
MKTSHNIFLVFLLTLNFSLLTSSSYSQWYYQSLPSYYSISDIKFFDANTGLMIFTTSYLGMLRTTNGGNNWTLIHNALTFYQLEKIDSTALYAIGRWNGVDRIQRTYDKGLTWDSVSIASYNAYTGLSFINRDTGWVSGANYLNYRTIWRTTNGGLTLNEQTNNTGRGRPFFLKQKVNGEYIGWHYSLIGDDLFWKTTNSGITWFQATRPPAQFPGYFEFYNENTGWFTSSGTGGGLYKSTNGGMNWTLQTLPSGNNINSTIYHIKIINLDTIYGGGGSRLLPGGILHPLIWKTTNGGINWGYQEADTSIHGGGSKVDFINSLTGWSYGGHGIHTTNGGGPITFTAIQNNNEIIAKDFVLYQNYPNPFNQLSIIKYQLSVKALVKIRIYDINGREIETLINKKQEPGTYKVSFNAEKLSSGVYFYALFADNLRIDTKKMLYVK